MTEQLKTETEDLETEDLKTEALDVPGASLRYDSLLRRRFRFRRGRAPDRAPNSRLLGELRSPRDA